MYKLSTSPESFFVLRNNFGKSLATMCIAHWLLGIGDRHLGNFLIDECNGQLIGIDFNMAFGAGTRHLRIPELVPFRLTAQFVNVLKPLETSGFLAKCMAHVLRTFRLESESLLSALEVIIVSEPHPNTASDPVNQTSTSSDVDSSVQINPWNSVKPLAAIKNKLSGINPMIPIENDLKSSVYS